MHTHNSGLVDLPSMFKVNKTYLLLTAIKSSVHGAPKHNKNKIGGAMDHASLVLISVALTASVVWLDEYLGDPGSNSHLCPGSFLCDLGPVTFS